VHLGRNADPAENLQAVFRHAFSVLRACQARRNLGRDVLYMAADIGGRYGADDGFF
jgi:hypothetical protein